MRRIRILQRNWSRISHKINDWLINQISTGISLPRRAFDPLASLKWFYWPNTGIPMCLYRSIGVKHKISIIQQCEN